jgi:amino acid adenylation domain-containing protein
MGFSKSKCLHEVFAENAKAHPGRIAAIFREERMTYGELDAQAGLLALALAAQGAGPGTLVGLCVDRNLDILVGILGILKAGAAYIPIDMDYPPERIRFILEDGNARLLVTSPETSLRIPDTGSRRALVQVRQEAAPDPSITLRGSRPEDLAYVIYTSGTTGNPKGVQIDHGNVMRLFETTRAAFGFGPSDTWSMFHSHCFDFSVWEIWGALLFGGRVALVPAEVCRSPRLFRQLLKEECVTMLSQTPSAFSQLVQEEGRSPLEDKLEVRSIVFGGEALHLGSLVPWVEKYGLEFPELVNMYGITETTVHVTYKKLTPADFGDLSASPIGSALGDLEMHLLDEEFRPVAPGTIGHLYVSGPGLSRGYLNRPELTEARFFHKNLGGKTLRLYHSGDLAVSSASGETYYMGRSDTQVQIRGYRVELGEIESALKASGLLSDAVAAPVNFGGMDVRVVAFVVPLEGGVTTDGGSRELAAACERKLPAHMRPSTYVYKDAIPLTSNGKADRSRLIAEYEATMRPEPAAGAGSPADAAKLAAQIWASVLMIPISGRDDDFFDLGGTSLAAIRLFNALQEAFGVEMELAYFLDGLTLNRISSFLEKDARNTQSKESIYP